MTLTAVVIGYLTLAYLFAAAWAQVEETALGVHVFAGVLLGIALLVTGAALRPFSDSELVMTAATVIAAFVVTQPLARWLYSADARQANSMSAFVAAAQLLGALFLNWAFSPGAAAP